MVDQDEARQKGSKRLCRNDFSNRRVTDPGCSSSRPRLLALIGAVRLGWPTIVFDVLGPVAAYHLAVQMGTGEVAALVWSAVPPAIILLTEGVRHRRVNGVGTMVLVSLALALLFAAIGGSAQQVVARDAYGSIVLGAVLVASVLIGRRPLLYYLLLLLGRDFAPSLQHTFAQHWTFNEYFRRYLRRTSLLIGGILLAESAVRMVAAERLPIDLTVAIFQVEGLVFWTALMVPLLVGYRRAVSRWSADAVDSAVAANIPR